LKTLYYSSETNDISAEIKLILQDLIPDIDLSEISTLADFETLAKECFLNIIINTNQTIIGRQRDPIVKLLYQKSESSKTPLYFINY